ncbi:MAG: hypothetical protein NXI31_24420 [bacterium]|nr:hypothetical protein [bacterium]
MKTARSLIHAWLVLDFFGDARRTGGNSSTLTTTIFTQAFLALVFAALLYPETPPIPFAAANLCLSSLLISVSVLGDQDRLDRQRADAILLGTSPVRPVHVVLARAGHAAFYVALLTIGMALPPAILLGFLEDSAAAGIAYVGLACICSGLATGALAVALGLVARLVGPQRAVLFGGTIKALLLGGGIALFALGLQNLRGTAADLPFGRAFAEILAPYHAARLLQFPDTEAWRAAVLVLAMLVLGLLALLTVAGDGGTLLRTRSGGPLTRLLQRIAGRGPTLAIAEFTAVNMWRSPGFRARVLPLLGLPAGMIYLSLRGDDAAAATDDDGSNRSFVFLCLLLQLPAIYLPFLIAFLPRADQDNTGWVFDQAPPVPLVTVRDAAWRALVTHVLVPVHAIAGALLVATSPQPLDVAFAALFSFGVAVVISRPMCAALRRIPFTDDSAAEPATDLGSLFPFALLLLGLAMIYGLLLQGYARYGMALGALAGAWLAIRRPVPRATPTAELPANGLADPAVTPTEAHSARSGPPSGSQPEITAEEQHASNGTTSTGAGPAGSDGALGRELRAVALLYVAVSVLPTLVGAMFAA